MRRWLGVAIGVLLLSGCEAGAMPDDAGAPSETEPAGAAPAEETDEALGDPATLTLAFAGDVHFEGGLAGLPAYDRATLGPMTPSLRDADLAVLNVETALTDRGAPTDKELEVPSARYWFRAPASALDLLGRSGVDVVSVANNHAADYGERGLRDTLAAAAQSEVAVIGAGLDATAAFAPHRVTIRGTSVAVIAADSSPRESADPLWAARPGTGPGIASARGDDTGRLLAAVRESAAVDDLVVVYLHWGEEGDACATDAQQSLAADLSEAGADIVVGTHAHVPLGAGLLGDTYVSYGLGNFFWYHGLQDETGVLRLRVRDGEVLTDEWVPGMIRRDGGNPQPLTGPARARAVEDWRALRGCTDLAPGPSEAAEAAAAPAATELPSYAAEVRPIGAALRRRMVGSSHDPAVCPVGLGDLRHLTVSYVDPGGRAQTGGLVVAADVADDVVSVFERLYEARFPITRMVLVDTYGGDDDRSMAADNTSGYNCRRVAGQTSWSDHAYGRAVDINPVRNPYVMGDTVLPDAGSAYVSVDRSPGAVLEPGVIGQDDVVTRAFASVGWTWGGAWSDPDYQHFSAP